MTTRKLAHPHYYAAVASDGMRPAVWGIAHTKDAAIADAAREMAEACDAVYPVIVVQVDTAQATRIVGGVFDCGDLGIALTPSQIRELAE